MGLGERDLALLSALIYSDYVVKQKEGTKLNEVVYKLLDIIENKNTTADAKMEVIGKLYGDFGFIKEHEGVDAALDRFAQTLRAIAGSTKLMDLTIVKPLKNDGTKAGITAACFLDSSGAATVVFRGTDTSYEAWFDNIEGAGMTIATPMQETAKKYINSLGYEEITVTGHSKGGNLATFVAVLCSNVTKSVSFDGQGFSEAFHESYALLIAQALENKDIKTIAAHNDLVNTLLLSVGETVYVKNPGEGFEQAHFITNLVLVDEKASSDEEDKYNDFDDNGNFTSIVDADAGVFWANLGIDLLAMALSAPVEELLTDIGGIFGAAALSGEKITGEDVLEWARNVFSGFGLLATFEAVRGVVGTVVDAFIALGYGIANIGVGLFDIFTSGLNGQKIFEGIFKLLWGVGLVIWTLGEAILNLIIDIINFIINKVMEIVNGIGSLAGWVGDLFGQEWGWHFDVVSPIDKMPLPSYSLWETGGFPENNQPFIAREAGSELVGRLHGRTAVVNNNQIVAAVSKGVYGAFMSAMYTGSTTPAVEVYLDGRQIAMAG
ncbi:MAG: Mbeg1-like protein [Acutalibacteraceae bacterium]